MLSKYTLIVCLISTSILGAQNLTGEILDTKKNAVEGANVYWQGTQIGTSSDESGKFELAYQPNKSLVINHAEFGSDTIINPALQFYSIQLTPRQFLDGIEINSTRVGEVLSTIGRLNVENLTACELKKAPCCTLAESFVNNGTVDVLSADAVTGTREVQMLGLKGLYTQTLIENRPSLDGIGQAYNLDFIPGTWIESIQIAKGATSVLTDGRALTGQINTEILKPYKAPPLFVNLFGSDQARYEINLNVANQLNANLSQIALLHYSGQNDRTDRDGDGFIDNPLRKTFSGMYRLFYRSKNWNSEVNYLLASDRRKSGQFAHPANDDEIGGHMHIFQNNDRHEIFGKVAYLGLRGAYESMGFQYTLLSHELNNSIGTRKLDSSQKEATFNLFYKNILKTPDHGFTIGPSLKINQIQTSFSNYNFNLNEVQTSFHGEYTYEHANSDEEEEESQNSFWTKFGALAGLRLENFRTGETFLVPRFQLKYGFDERTILRYSFGRGVRRPLPITDQIALTASNRSWIVAPQLPIEDGWNTGMNFTKAYEISEQPGQFALDAYYTIFNTQVVYDSDIDPRQINVYALTGRSEATSLQALWRQNIILGLELKLVYRHTINRIDYQKGSRFQTFIPRDRFLATLHYTTPNKKWQFNTVAQYTGLIRMPDTEAIPSIHLEGNGNYSKEFWRFDAQVTRYFKSVEIYLNVENIGNFIQKHAIVQSHDPFGEYFDAARIYGPMNGRVIGLGIRWTLNKKEEE